MTAVRWEKDEGKLAAYLAYSGQLCIGHVVERSATPGRWAYKLDAVHTRHITKGNGEVGSPAAARRAVERAWAAWTKMAGL